jgi:hypothetical protein
MSGDVLRRRWRPSVASPRFVPVRITQTHPGRTTLRVAWPNGLRCLKASSLVLQEARLPMSRNALARFGRQTRALGTGEPAADAGENQT